MKYTPLLLVVLAVWPALSAADSEHGPLQFLFNHCDDQAEEASGVGSCVRQLLRDALDRARPRFSTGFQVGNETVILEPLKMPKPEGGRQGRSNKLEISEAQMKGLSKVRIDSVLLTENAAAAKVEFPEISGEMRGKIRYGFLPIRATVKVQLNNPRLMVGSHWSVSDGQLQLEEPHAQLWLDSYNVTISGFGSMGTTIATNLNDNHKEIIEFLRPSLEAAVARRLGKMSQDEKEAVLGWLEQSLS
ncbi:hypothetical protein FJT64_026319 [Amphibalanus amphitrite]|uniref:Protein takeout n=1 Tax=Amphibalanus amphitrite TaxID=1232801 RepID=A0A6A4WH15_AMPAM|nr:hypothetical protein FJT64_026319 [Amphibalanus amphitrite]